MTHYDKLRNMGPEELAGLIAMIKIRACERTCEECGHTFFFTQALFEKVRDEVLELLNSEAD